MPLSVNDVIGTKNNGATFNINSISNDIVGSDGVIESDGILLNGDIVTDGIGVSSII